MKLEKICVVTGSRAEYGLLYWLLKEIEADKGIQLQLIITGMHLSPEFGLTYRQIEADGFVIDKKVECILSADTPVSIVKSMALAEIGFADAYSDLQPDLLVVLGDRSEILAAALAAAVMRIPIAHLHGGELTEGAADDFMRHSITKMAQLHFVATEEYRRRVIQLGEQPASVFNVGAFGLDGIRNLKLLSKEQVESELGIRLLKKNILVTFHPVTLEHATAAKQFVELLAALSDLKDTFIIFTKPNSDADGRILIELIDKYVAENKDSTACFTSLGHLNYLSLLQFVDAIVGNSSSGLIEAPSFNIGTINIGDRQTGRIKTSTVIDCMPTVGSIKVALEKLYSVEFQTSLKTVSNPYGNGEASQKTLQYCKAFEFKGSTKKKFFDVDFQ